MVWNMFRYLFILFKINDRRTRGPLILSEVHENTKFAQNHESFRCGSPVWCTADVWAYRIVTATTAFSFARYWACLSVVWLRDQFWLCIICFVWSITCPFFIVTQMSRNINSSVLWILVCNYLCCIFIVAADFMLWFSCNSLSNVCMNAASNVDFLYVCC